MEFVLIGKEDIKKENKRRLCRTKHSRQAALGGQPAAMQPLN